MAIQAIATPEQRFTEDAGPNRKSFLQTHWEKGNYSEIFRAFLAKGFSIITEARMTAEQNSTERFPVLVDQFALGHVPAAKGPRNIEHEHAMSKLEKTTDLLFGRILTLVDGVEGNKASKASLAIAKTLISATLMVKSVPADIRKKVERAFQANVKKAAAQRIVRELREPLAQHLTSGKALSTLANVVVKRKNDLQKFVKRGYFANEKEAQKEVLDATAAFLASQLMSGKVNIS